jgi:hypothetical protein
VTRRKPYPPCIYCGAKANSRAHAIPEWISKQLGIKEFIPAETYWGWGGKPRKQPISFSSYRAVHILCGPCNTHFGSNLEEPVIPLLVPMAKGMNLSLGQDSQALLALWAVNTGLTLIAMEHPEIREIVPVDHRRSIRYNDRPADETFVGYFPWRGGTVIGTGLGFAAPRNRQAAPNDAYIAIFAFAQIGFKVFGLANPLPAGRVIDGEWDSEGSIRQFWPLKHSMIDWPPGPELTNAVMRRLLGEAPIRRA